MERTKNDVRFILIVEDDPSISELLTWVLSESGYRVIDAGSLREARQICKRKHPDLVIADLLLPDGLGTDLIYDLSRSGRGQTPPSIVMSAVPQAENHARSVGARMCVTKPFDLVDLLDTIEELIKLEPDDSPPHRVPVSATDRSSLLPAD